MRGNQTLLEPCETLNYEKKNEVTELKNHEVTELKNHEVTKINIGELYADKRLGELVIIFINERSEHCEHQTMKDYFATFRHYSFLTLADFDKPHATKYFESKANASWKKITSQKHLIKLSAFGNWLCASHYTHQRFHPKPKRQPTERKVLDTFELELLFDSLYQDWLNSSDIKKFRNHQRYLIVRCLYETGGRISEVTGIYLDDIRIKAEGKQIFLDGTKTESSKRTVWISEKLFSELNDFRNQYELEGRLFSSTLGNIIDISEFGKWLRLYGEKLDLSCKIHPHLFRYLFIIESIKKGKDAIEVMTRLGHSDVSMTIYYFNQVRRLYPEAELSASISILEKKKGFNSKHFGKTKLYG